MKVVEEAIGHPVTTAVGVILLLLFGGLALTRIPVQLTPTVEEPEISVTTVWPGASPQEVESEIVDEQEEQLKSLEGLVEMVSTSTYGVGDISLTFQTGTEIDTALLKVSNRLQQVPEYPPDAERPVLLSIGAEMNPIVWYVLLPHGEEPFEGDVATLYDFLDDYVKPEIERVPGVAAVDIFGGRPHEMRVVVDPARLAARQVTLTELVAALDRENRDWSGGEFDEGKRRYVVRTLGEYRSPEEIEEVVVAVRGGVPVYVRDVARAELGYRRDLERGFYNGDQKMLAINAQREVGSNVLEVTRAIETTVERLNRELLAPRGLVIHQTYNETEYIEGSIDLVQQSLVLGGALAIVVLLLFLRSRTSTLVIAVAIPISVVGTFLMMLAFGRTLNVISLAGMAFAVGMVVDNSIVVLENVYRHRQLGKPRAVAAYEGAREVWGAVLASTLTTIAVFVPILFVEEEAGQLFRDLAIAISCAVALSLVVAMTVIPALSAKILGGVARRDGAEGGFRGLWGLAAAVGGIGRGVTRSVYRLCGSTPLRLAVVLGLTAAAIGLSLWLSPQAEYLPAGNRNFIFGVVSSPPGYNLDEKSALRGAFVERLGELWETPAAAAGELPGGGLEDFFFIAMPQISIVAGRANDAERIREVVPAFQAVNADLPGTMAMVSQLSLFQRGLDQGRTIDVNLTGPELEKLLELGMVVYDRISEVLPGGLLWTIPELDDGGPELQLVPDRRRAAELGISSRDLGLAVSALVDGVKASEYRFEGRKIDLQVMAEPGSSHRTHLLEQLPIATPDGRLVTLGSVARFDLVSGPTEIRHVERDRAVTLQVTPPETVPLQAAMERIESRVLAPLTAEGQLGGLYRARLAGSADKLSQTGRALASSFVLALVITYLLMAALFEDFLYPFVILLSVPLAALGGFLGLAVLNLFTYQALDVLTMLGFIILVGTVVNNAILIVHQTLNTLRDEGLDPREAIRDAVSSRVRPIFMSVATSIFGMLPLVLFPGPGSELYRGLGSVVVGGLAVSTVFTLFLVPALLSLVLDARMAAVRRVGRRRFEPSSQTVTVE